MRDNNNNSPPPSSPPPPMYIRKLILTMDDNSLWRNDINEDNYHSNVHKTRWKQLLNEKSFEVQ